MNEQSSNEHKEELNNKWVLTAEEKKRLVDFFSILIEVDHRNKRKSHETQSN